MMGRPLLRRFKESAMNSRFVLRAACLTGCLFAGTPFIRAALNTYTNVSDFDSAVASGFGAISDLDFDSLVSGSTLASGSTVQGITFTYTIGGGAFDLQVGSTFDTTSTPNYLGTTGDDAFLSGDSFTMTFATPESAVGLFVISGGIDFAGDYTLSTALGSVDNSDSTDSTYGTLGDGGAVYFLGMVETDPTMTFTSATFSSLAGLGIPFDIDDIVTTVATSSGPPPLPDPASTLTLLAGACGGLFAFRRRCR
jgi:hypothetical protein